MKKNIFLYLVGVIIISLKLYADEGMWLPFLLSETVEAEMKRLGMRITAEDIYSVNNSSLKDAVVLFGRGCTGVIVSEGGLLLTNHHCAIGRIQAHSTVENDYIKNGFWARSLEEELPNPGLEVRIVVYMKDVTDRILGKTPANVDENIRQQYIRMNITDVIKEATKNNQYEARVLPFFYGNQYILVVYEVFRDVRLVGAPPSYIGNFGGDTDNWMWPRYSGDFAWFRIYADKNNNPAPFSSDNVPYAPRRYVPITLQGVEEGDFAFVLGFPGRTNIYSTSHEVQMIRHQRNPVCIDIRRHRLDVIEKYMKLSDTIRIQYTARRSGIANFWKKMIGENSGIDRFQVIEKKQTQEQEIQNWLSEHSPDPQYAYLFQKFDSLYSSYVPAFVTNEILWDGAMGIDIIRAAIQVYRLWEMINQTNQITTDIQNELQNLNRWSQQFYKEFNKSMDMEIFHRLLPYLLQLPEPYTVTRLHDLLKRHSSNEKFLHYLYDRSIFASYRQFNQLLETSSVKKLQKILNSDPVFLIALDIVHLNNLCTRKLDSLNLIKQELYRHYIQILMQIYPDRHFWPDANQTLRVSYGTVSSTKPMDAVTYRYYTTTDGILERSLDENEDYEIKDAFREFLLSAQWGPYARKDGTMPVAFITNVHTTGGNSGSPVFNADGHLIGLNFDRAWEGVMSDYYYEPTISRNISVDIRYVLLITDLFANAQHIIKELKIIR